MVLAWRPTKQNKPSKLQSLKHSSTFRTFPLVSTDPDLSASISKDGQLPLLKRINLPKHLDDLSCFPISSVLLSDDKNDSFKYVSAVLAAEKRLKEIELVNQYREQPNPLVLSLSMKWFKSMFASVAPCHQTALDLWWTLMEPVVFSGISDGGASMHSEEDLGKYIPSVPWFVRSSVLEQKNVDLEAKVANYQHITNTAERLKEGCIKVCSVMQVYNAGVMLQITFLVWVNAVRMRQRLRASVLLISRENGGRSINNSIEPQTCFLAWRLSRQLESLKGIRQDLTKETRLLAINSSKERLRYFEQCKLTEESNTQYEMVEKLRKETEDERRELQKKLDIANPKLVAGAFKNKISELNDFLCDLIGNHEIAREKLFKDMDFNVLKAANVKSRMQDPSVEDPGKDVRKKSTVGGDAGMSPMAEIFDPTSAKIIILRWLNYHLKTAKAEAGYLLDPNHSASNVAAQWNLKDQKYFYPRVEKVFNSIPPIDNFGPDTMHARLSVNEVPGDSTPVDMTFDASSGGATTLCSSALDVDFGPALCVLFAIIRHRIDGTSSIIFDLPNLRPLDIDDPRERAQETLQCIRAVSDNKKALRFVTADAICRGAASLLVPFLCETMLRFPCLPRKSEAMKLLGSSTVEGKRRNAFIGITYTFEESNDWSTITSTLISECEGLLQRVANPSKLLRPGERLMDLVSLVTMDDFILRWLNFQISERLPDAEMIEHFHPGLEDGAAILRLLHIVAPDVTGGRLDTVDILSRAERLRLIVRYAPRICEFEITDAAFTAEKQDLLGILLVSLFQHRPGLDMDPNSQLGMHWKTLSWVVKTGYDVVDGDNYKEMTEFCEKLREKSDDVTRAIEAFKEAKLCMDKLNVKMTSFTNEVLSARALNQSRLMKDAKQRREFLSFTKVSEHRLALAIKRGSRMDIMINPQERILKIESTLMKHYQLLSEIYTYYGSPDPNGTGAATWGIESALNLYQDAKLRSKQFPVHAAEDMFYEVLERSKLTTLVPETFIDLILHFATVRYATKADTLADRLEKLITDCLIPHAMKSEKSEFQRYAYSQEVRKIFADNEEELKAIFTFYAELDQEEGAVSNTTTMNLAEFKQLCTHLDLFDGRFDKTVMIGIFNAIQNSSTNADMVEEGMDDDDELSYTEFLEGWVAITLYMDPNPFIQFRERLEYFLMTCYETLTNHFLAELEMAGATEQADKVSRESIDAAVPKKKAGYCQKINNLLSIGKLAVFDKRETACPELQGKQGKQLVGFAQKTA